MTDPNSALASKDSAKSSNKQPLKWHRINLLLGLIGFLIVLCMPTPAGMSPEAQRLAAITVLMAIYWVTEALPIAATSLIPLALYPTLNILSAGQVSRAYGDPTIFLFVGGFLLALGIERWNLHRRIALHILKRVGSSHRMIVLGFMLSTGGISMWISNSAAALMMVPIGLALVKTLRESIPADDLHSLRIMDRLTISVLLGIAYAASIGGIATYVGTPPNMVFRGFWNQQFVSQGAPDVTFAEWMLVFTPASLVFLVIASFIMTATLPALPGASLLTRQFFAEELAKLGRISAAERRVASLFSIAALLWIFREPLVIEGREWIPSWISLPVAIGQWFGQDLSFLTKTIQDSTIAIGMSLLLFILPGESESTTTLRPRLLSWKEAERGLPWGMLLLFGGGFALADAFISTQLADFVGQSFSQIATGQSPFTVMISVCALVTALTEFTSNTATANMLMPVMSAVADQLRLDPRLLLIPATISASCGFMMPVGTPPNAIVFATGKIPIRTMLIYGFVLNVVGIILVSGFMWFVATAVMGIPTTPLPAIPN